jgi:hypothetical protein
MTRLLECSTSWQTLILVLVAFGFVPGFCLRLIVLVYPRGDPRRAELIAELYTVPRIQRPLWVAEQLEVALFEGLPHRISATLRKLSHRYRGRAQHGPHRAKLWDLVVGLTPGFSVGNGLVLGVAPDPGPGVNPEIMLMAHTMPGPGPGLAAGITIGGAVGIVVGIGIVVENRLVVRFPGVLVAGIGAGLGTGLMVGLAAWLAAVMGTAFGVGIGGVGVGIVVGIGTGIVVGLAAVVIGRLRNRRLASHGSPTNGTPLTTHN